MVIAWAYHAKGMQNGRQLGRGMQARLTEIAGCDTRLAELVIRLVEAGHGAVHFVPDFSRISALVAVRLQIAVSWSPLSTAAKVMPR